MAFEVYKPRGGRSGRIPVISLVEVTIFDGTCRVPF